MKIFVCVLMLVGVCHGLPLLVDRSLEICMKDKVCIREKLEPLKMANIGSELLCDLCIEALPVVKKLIEKNETKYFRDIATLVCTALNITQEPICYQAVGLFEGAVISIINDTTLSAYELCSIELNCGPVNNPVLNWNISLPSVPKPPVVPPIPPSPSAPKLRILQLSDLHIDFEYQPGSLADCGQPLCCRNSSSSDVKDSNASRLAGYWGDYRNCDVPLWTVENMFEYIAKNEEFDVIYWTGDLPPHNVWNQTRNDQLNALKVLTGLFKKYFPNKPIYPTLGNHESTPVNLYPPPYVKEDNIDWLYSELANDWTQTGVPVDLKQDIRTGAFYSLPLYPGLRLVSLNMNYCPGGNFWLYINSTDPLNQLSWLVKILNTSESIGEKVHIIGHVHPDGCLDSWSQNYYRIVNRYESTIVGQFFGHSHSDSFRVFYDLNNITRPVSVLYISGSVTTYSYLNPAYRIYSIDGNYEKSSWQVLDHENYYMNLTDANLSKNPIWQKEYSAKDAYNLTGLYPQDWANLLNVMLSDLKSPLVDKLFDYYNKLSDARGTCDVNCRRGFVCDFKQARSDSFIPC